MNVRNCALLAFILGTFALRATFAQAKSAKGKLEVTKDASATIDGKSVDIYTLRNGHGMEVRAMSYGGIILSLRTIRLTSAELSAAMPIALPTAPLRSMARSTPCPKTTAPIRSMADSLALTSSFGAPNHLNIMMGLESSSNI